MTTASYCKPSGRSTQSLGISPDIVVEQPVPPPVDPNAPAETPEEATARKTRSEADLRGALSNDSMTDDEKKVFEEEQKQAEEAAKRRQDDYQMAYAIDIIKGLTVVSESK